MDNPISASSSVANTPAIRADNSAPGNGFGVFASSMQWEAVHGESHSLVGGGVTGLALNPAGTGAGIYGEARGKGAGVWGKSDNAEGVHGETTSPTFAAVSGIQLNTTGTGAGVYGSTSGKGFGVFGTSTQWEGVHGESHSLVGGGVTGLALNPAGTGAGIYGEAQGKGAGVWGRSANAEGVHGETTSPIFAAVSGIQLNTAGTGAGVYGENRGPGPAGFFKGDVIVTGDVLLQGADCAEDFDLSGAADAPPGSVMVITETGELRPCEAAYDRTVAGVVSGAGPFRPAIRLDHQATDRRRCAIALIGKAGCLVDASFGAIRVGDLLTTSTTPGHAMRIDDPQRAFGTVIGKALGALSAGQGLVPVLVALQ